MGRKLVIQGADFSANGIVIPMTIKIKAGQSTVINGTTYSGGANGEFYELDAFPTTFHESSAVTYLEQATISSDDFTLKDGYFQYQQGLEKVSFLASAINTTNDLKTTFMYCTNLTEIVGLDKLDTSGVVNMSQMFRSCSKLTSLDVSHFDTSAVTTFSNMFAGCKVSSLDLSSFDTSNATDMSRIFSGCDSLQTLVLGEDFDLVGKTVTDLFYFTNKLASIVAPNCLSTDYGTANTQLMALVNAIQGSGYNSNRNANPLVITCGDGKTVTGTYVHGSGCTWAVSS